MLGGYCSGGVYGESVRDEIIRLCAELKADAVTLSDTLAVPDEILNSALGKSDGWVRESSQGGLDTGNPLGVL